MKVKYYDEYDEYDDYEIGGYKKMKHSNSKKEREKNQTKERRARRKEIDFLNEIENLYWDGPAEETCDTELAPKKASSEESAPLPVPEKPQLSNDSKTIAFDMGPNTHTIKGNVIDFDRVADVEKVENEHRGKLTYGIKFLFSGKKGLSRIAWFNGNITERDRIYNKERSFWEQLQK